MTASTKQLTFEMSIGMFAYVLALAVLELIFRNGLSSVGFLTGPVLLGLLCGFLADELMLIHMAFVTERALDSRDENYANRFTLIQSLIRRIVFIAAVVLACFIPQIDAIALIIGSFGLKAGAYLQPVIHRTFFSDKEGQ